MLAAGGGIHVEARAHGVVATDMVMLEAVHDLDDLGAQRTQKKERWSSEVAGKAVMVAAPVHCEGVLSVASYTRNFLKKFDVEDMTNGVLPSMARPSVLCKR